MGVSVFKDKKMLFLTLLPQKGIKKLLELIAINKYELIKIKILYF